MRFASRLTAVVGAVACTGAVLAGGASSATAGMAPPATTGTIVAFRVPLISDPAQTAVHVSGEIVDPMVDNNLNAFAIIIDCDGLAPVHVRISAPTVQTTTGSPVLHAAIAADLPVAEEGGLCSIETTAPSLARALVFGQPSTKPGGPGDTVRLNFLGTVLLNVTKRGGAY